MVCVSADSNLDTNVDDPDDLQEEEFDWFVDQQPYEEETTAISAPKYGFAGQKTGILKRLQVITICSYSLT